MTPEVTLAELAQNDPIKFLFATFFFVCMISLLLCLPICLCHSLWSYSVDKYSRFFSLFFFCCRRKKKADVCVWPRCEEHVTKKTFCIAHHKHVSRYMIRDTDPFESDKYPVAIHSCRADIVSDNSIEVNLSDVDIVVDKASEYNMNAVFFKLVRSEDDNSAELISALRKKWPHNNAIRFNSETQELERDWFLLEKAEFKKLKDDKHK